MSRRSRAQKQRARQQPASASTEPSESAVGPALTKTQKRKLQKKRQQQQASAQHNARAAKPRASPPSTSLGVVHEDEHVIAINKPAGLLCHPSPGFWNAGTVVHHLSTREQTAGYSEIGPHMLEARLSHTGEDDSFIPRAIVHRLDRGTTGLMLVAKTELAETQLTNQFKQRSLSKRYVALLCGRPRTAAAGTSASHGRVAAELGGAILRVDAPIDRDPSRPGKMVVNGSGKAARSVVHVHAVSSTGPRELTLVTVELLTGRQHQIRVHCAQVLGAPLANDDAYGGERTPGAPKNRPLLHAWSMEVPPPATGELLSMRAPLPDDMSALLREHFPQLPGIDPASWPECGV